MLENIVNEVIKQAKMAEKVDEVPIGAVICRGGEIIARAHNIREQGNDIMGHAEIIAIKRAAKKLGSWKLDDCELYVSITPCIMCAGAIIQSRIKKVYVLLPSDCDEKFVLDIFLHNQMHKVELREVDDGGRTKQILSKYFKNKRRKTSEKI